MSERQAGMMIDWQDMVVLCIVLGSGIFLVRRLWRTAIRPRGCGCSMPCKTQSPIKIGDAKPSQGRKTEH